MKIPDALLGDPTPARGRVRCALAAAILVFSAFSWLGHGGLRNPTFDVDSFDYAQMSRQVWRGEGFTMQQTFPYVLRFLREHGVSTEPPWPNTTRFPLIALQEAAAFAVVGPNDLGILAAGGAMFMASALVAFLLGNRLFGPLAGSLAAAATVTEPMQLHFSRSGLLETGAGFFTLLVALTLAATTEAERRRNGAAVALGMALGLGFLQRYDLLAFAPVAAVLMLARSRAPRAPLALWCAVGFALTAGLWLARNLLTVGTVLGTTSIDRNLLGGVVPGDVYMGTQTVNAWRYAIEHWPEFLGKFEVARIWFVVHAASLFGGALAMAGAALALVSPALVKSRPVRTVWLFLVGGFATRAILLSIMHNEPRFYLSFTPLLFVLGAGGAIGVLRMLPAVARPLVPLAATLAFAGAALAVPRGDWAPISGEPPGEFAVISRSIAPGTVVASDLSWNVAWYCDRPSVRFSGAWPELVEIERLGTRVGAVLVTRRAARDFLAAHVSAGGKAFTRASSSPAGYHLWLRNPDSASLAGG